MRPWLTPRNGLTAATVPLSCARSRAGAGARSILSEQSRSMTSTELYITCRDHILAAARNFRRQQHQQTLIVVENGTIDLKIWPRRDLRVDFQHNLPHF